MIPSENPGAAVVEQLYRRFAPKVRRVLSRQVGDDDLAQDLTQEAFIRALRFHDQYDPSRPAWPWLNRVVQTVLVDEVARKKRPNVTPLSTVAAADLARVLPPADPAELFDSALFDLTPRQRKAIIMRHLIGFDRREVARREGISTTGADTLLLRAKQALREAVFEQAREGDKPREQRKGTRPKGQVA